MDIRPIVEKNKFIYELISVDIVAVQGTVYIFLYHVTVSPNPD
jgi:hypothetical protein